MTGTGLIQVAGVIDRREAEMLIACGVQWLGFPLRLPVHREDLSETRAAAIIAGFPERVRGLLITYLDEAGEIAGLCRRLGVDWVQLHGDIAVEELARLRRARPRLRVIKSLIVGRYRPAELRRQIEATAGLVDGYITDTYDPVTGASGATGRTHDWAVSRALAALSPRPLILAGGLTPDNVREAIRQVRPAGVDVHTGIEGPDGRKDAAMTRRFLYEARAGFAGVERRAARSGPAFP
ncbi:MAG: phosphoribosylanthranilate isomerase [Gammaproteobacteria bacterium]